MVVHLILATAGAACATCGRIGFARNAATTFDVSYWLEVTANFGETRLVHSTPNGPDYIDIWPLWLHAPLRHCCRIAPHSLWQKAGIFCAGRDTTSEMQAIRGTLNR